MGYGDAILAKLGSHLAVEAYWNAAQPHLQARYCHVSLGTKIKIERIGNFKHYKGKIFTATNENLNSAMATKITFKDIGEADMIAFLGYDSKNEDFKGLANSGACQPCDAHVCTKKTITEWQSTAAAQGSVRLKPNFFRDLA